MMLLEMMIVDVMMTMVTMHEGDSSSRCTTKEEREREKKNSTLSLLFLSLGVVVRHYVQPLSCGKGVAMGTTRKQARRGYDY
jgi:hypothetical protein